LIITAADRHRIPGGGALVMDREGFSREVTAALAGHPRIELLREEFSGLTAWLSQNPQTRGYLLIASGPLTSDVLARQLADLTGEESLYFYDSIAPIVSADSIDFDKVFRASRYDKGTADYLNCPLT